MTALSYGFARDAGKGTAEMLDHKTIKLALKNRRREKRNEMNDPRS